MLKKYDYFRGSYIKEVIATFKESEWLSFSYFKGQWVSGQNADRKIKAKDEAAGRSHKKKRINKRNLKEGES